MWQALADRVSGPATRTLLLLPGGDYRIDERRKDDGYADPVAAVTGHALKAVEYLVARCLTPPEERERLSHALVGLDRLPAAEELVPRSDLGGGLINWLSSNNIGCRMWLDVDEEHCQPIASYRHSGQPGALHIRYPSGARAIILPLAGNPDSTLFGLITSLGAAFEALEAVKGEEKAIQVVPVAEKDAVDLKAFNRTIRIQGMAGKLLVTLSGSRGQHFGSKTLMKHIGCTSLAALEQQYKNLRIALRKGGLSDEEIKRVIQARKPRGVDSDKRYWMPG